MFVKVGGAQGFRVRGSGFGVRGSAKTNARIS
jgi:hypothetical protein